MSTVVVAQRMWQRRDSAANWTAANPILAAGEIGVELGALPTDPQKFKIGNGVTAWSTLTYFGTGGGSGGSVWYTGSGAPSGGTGVDGDFYLRSSDGSYYQKIAGTWTLQGNLTGPAGAVGPMGPAGPAFSPSNYYLMHMDGANGSTSFPDLGGHTFVRVGAPVVSTAQSKFGGASARFNGGSDALKDNTPIQLSMSNEDFTIELWYYELVRAPGTSNIIWEHRSSTVAGNLVLDILPAGTIQLFQNAYILQPTNVLALNTWYHIAVVRLNGVITMYLNGVSIGSVANTSTFAPAPFIIGGRFDGAVGRSINGYVDEFRLSRGTARYTANFTPQTSAFIVPIGAQMPTYTLSTLPSASENPYVQIYVTDLTGGAEPCVSDGTNWRRFSDRSVAS